MATALNQTTLKSMSDMSQDWCMLQDDHILIPVTASPTIIDNYDEAVNGGLTLGSIVTGEMTAGRTGKALITISGSFDNGTAGSTGLLTMSIYIDGVDTGYGAERSISNQSSIGSFSGLLAHDVVASQKIDVRISFTGSAGDMNFAQFNFLLQWFD